MYFRPGIVKIMMMRTTIYRASFHEAMSSVVIHFLCLVRFQKKNKIK
jgi:hypothetical protein